MFIFIFSISLVFCPLYSFFFFNDTATTEIYTLSLHDALPISGLALEELDVDGAAHEALGRRDIRHQVLGVSREPEAVVDQRRELIRDHLLEPHLIAGQRQRLEHRVRLMQDDASRALVDLA